MGSLWAMMPLARKSGDGSHVTGRGHNMTTVAAGRIFTGVIESALEAVREASVATQKAELQIEAFAKFAMFDPATEAESDAPSLSTSEMKAALAVAKTGSFTKAAQGLGLSQPGLSRQVQRVEKAYGIKILYRRGGGAEATPAGSLVLEAFSDALNALARSVEAARKLS